MSLAFIDRHQFPAGNMPAKTFDDFLQRLVGDE